jgi:predicted DsbA family dithiol-disulfide isomerase
MEEDIKIPGQKNKQQYTRQEADGIDILYYTDPLCCWSWAFEPQWRRLQYEFSGKITWRYCMGGLLPGWKDYHDPVNSVSRPAQMGPVWMHARQLSGMPMHDRVWIKDPPFSSYPACVAVKCACLQSLDAGEKYLQLLRGACMVKGWNIARQAVLIKVATCLVGHYPLCMDLNRFTRDIKNYAGLEAFREDLQNLRYHNIKRFPTLVIRSSGQPAIIITGYRPYPVLLEALKQAAPHIEKTHDTTLIEEYEKHCMEGIISEVNDMLQ